VAFQRRSDLMKAGEASPSTAPPGFENLHHMNHPLLLTLANRATAPGPPRSLENQLAG
jgi:hypothetical protein